MGGGRNAQAVTNPFDYTHRWSDGLLPGISGDLGIDVDIVDMDDPLEGYSLDRRALQLHVPGRLCRDRVRKIHAAEGGTYVTTCWSGEVDDERVSALREPASSLADVLGIRTEEIDVIAGLRTQPGDPGRGQDYDYPGTLCALVHAEAAEVLGAPTRKISTPDTRQLTVNRYGEGEAYFIASANEEPFYRDFLKMVAEETGTGCTLKVSGELPKGVTVNERRGEEENDSLWFVQNFNAGETAVEFEDTYRDIETGEAVSGECVMKGYQCLILEKI